MDGSYCGYSAFGTTGDSPGKDAQYPDESGLPGAYAGSLECGTYNLTRVVSISYRETQVYLPKAYVGRQCNEIMKLGLQGHSILVVVAITASQVSLAAITMLKAVFWFWAEWHDLQSRLPIRVSIHHRRWRYETLPERYNQRCGKCNAEEGTRMFQPMGPSCSRL